MLQVFFTRPPSPDSIHHCEHAGIIGTVVDIMGIIQANEIIKYILDIGKLLSGKLDSLDSSFEKIFLCLI